MFGKLIDFVYRQLVCDRKWFNVIFFWLGLARKPRIPFQMWYELSDLSSIHEAMLAHKCNQQMVIWLQVQWNLSTVHTNVINIKCFCFGYYSGKRIDVGLAIFIGLKWIAFNVIAFTVSDVLPHWESAQLKIVCLTAMEFCKYLKHRNKWWRWKWNSS